MSVGDFFGTLFRPGFGLVYFGNEVRLTAQSPLLLGLVVPHV
jgi:hypothetical protein